MTHLITLADQTVVHSYYRYETTCGLPTGGCDSHKCRPDQKTDMGITCRDCRGCHSSIDTHTHNR